jgi:hypothetical protein
MPRTFSGTDGDVERFILQLGDYLGLVRITDDLDKIRTAGMLCDGKAGHWYETYRLKIDRRMAMRVLGKWVEDPKFQTWDHFEATLRDSHGGRPRRQKDVNKIIYWFLSYQRHARCFISLLSLQLILE